MKVFKTNQEAFDYINENYAVGQSSTDSMISDITKGGITKTTYGQLIVVDEMGILDEDPLLKLIGKEVKVVSGDPRDVLNRFTLTVETIVGGDSPIMVKVGEKVNYEWFDLSELKIV